MSQENDWPAPVDAEDKFAQDRRRADIDRRRPLVRKASDIMGPGLAPHAVTIDDLNGETATFNGIFYAPAGTLNSPDTTKDWIGETIATAEEGGRQTFSTFKAADTPQTWTRSFAYIPGTKVSVFTAWVNQSSAGVFVGAMMVSPNGSVPTGWLACDGSAVSRTTYADLFAYLGTSRGAGNGTTTFNLPNLKGRTPVGLDTAQTEFNAIGKQGGAKAVALTTDNMAPAGGYTLTGTSSQKQASGGTQGSFVFAVSAVYQALPHNNLQPYSTELWVIKT